MEAEQVQAPQVAKRLYRNNTGGFVGVVQLNHRGDEEGVNIEPYGTIWLSDVEATLTARAPRDPANNPFEEQMMVRPNPDTGEIEEVRLRPVTLVSDEERYVPSQDRYVPTGVDQSAALPPSPEVLAREQHERSQPAGQPPPASAAPVVAAPPVQSGGAASPPPAAAPGEPDAPESWNVPPEAPGQVLAGSLAGGDVEDEVAAAQPPSVHAQAAPQTPGAVPEETGAAKPPAGPPPEGEYARAEEVGSPRTGLIGEDV